MLKNFPLVMEHFEGGCSSLRPMKRPKEYYDANDSFIVRLPSNLRGSGEPEFHIGKDILNRSGKYADWGGNDVLSRMQRKYCFSPTNCHRDMNFNSSPFPCEAMTPNLTTPSNSYNTPKELTPQKTLVNNTPFITDDMSHWLQPNVRNGNNNQCNWASSHIEPTNNWSESQMAPTNNWSESQMAPTKNWCKQFINSSGIHNSFYNNASDVQKTNRTFFHSEKNNFNHGKKNGYFVRSQAGNNDLCNEFSDHRSSYNQKDVQNEYKHLISAEKKEKPQKFQGSKLLSSLPRYSNEKALISTLENKNPKSVIFVDLSYHHRFLHKFPQCLPGGIHLIAFFDDMYRFPVFVNASLEQLIKSECFHIHPASSSRNARSQRFFANTIYKSHNELSRDILFILLTAQNPVIGDLIKHLQTRGRQIVSFLPGFQFSDFHSLLRKHQTNRASLLS